MKVEMKDSGIEWIGKIPHDWQVVRIKNTSLLKGRIGWQGLKSSEYLDEGAYLITGTDFQNGFISWEKCVRISKERFDEAPEIHIKENDLLITKDGTIGKVAVAINCPNEVSLNSGVLLIRNTKQIKYYSKYIFYVLMSDVFWNWYYSNQTGGSTIQHLYQEQFYNFTHILPPFQLQQQIANFLDDKCADIDQLITLQQQMIEELKAYKQSVITEAVCKGLDKSVPMKDSGIEWIGEVPEGWKIVKLKNVAKFKTGGTPNGYDNISEETKRVFWFTPSDFNEDYRLNVSSRFLNSEIIKNENISLFPKHTILFVGIGATAGKVGIMTDEGYSNQQITAIIPNNQILPMYLLYTMISGTKIIRDLANYTTLPIINNSFLKEIVLVCPTYEEQNEIVSYLDKKSSQIDTLISIKQQKIDELKEYKKSIIYEYITGKKQVPN